MHKKNYYYYYFYEVRPEGPNFGTNVFTYILILAISNMSLRT